MAWAFLRNGPSGSNKTSGTTCAITGVQVNVGELIAVLACSISGSSASLNAPTDPRSNTWVIGTGQGSGTGNSQACWMWSLVTTQILSSDTITVNYNESAATGAHSALSFVFSGGTTTTDVAGAGATGVNTTPSATIVPTLNNSLVLGGVGVTGPSGDTFTADNDTTNGTWSSARRVGTTGGSGASNSTSDAQYKIITASGSQTYNPTLGTSRGWADACEVLVAATATATFDSMGSYTTDPTALLGVEQAVKRGSLF